MLVLIPESVDMLQALILSLTLLLFVVILTGGLFLYRMHKRNIYQTKKDSLILLSLMKSFTSHAYEQVNVISDEINALIQKGSVVPVNVRNSLLEIDKNLNVAKERIRNGVDLCQRASEHKDVDMAELAKVYSVAQEKTYTNTETPHIEEEKQDSKMSYPSSNDSFMDRFNSLVERNLSNTELSVAFIASEMCVSRSGLFAKVKEATGDTPNNIINNARLTAAAKLLEEKKHPINEICYMVGFSSPSYFSRCFDKHYGMTPHEWMNKPLKEK